MKTTLPLLLLLAHSLTAATSPDWITETPLEFITTGRFQTPSAGTDLLVVDKATGLARIGLHTAGGIHWSEQSTGMAAVTGLTTLRHGAQDQIAVSSATWNAVQLVAAGGSPLTLTSPVIGPHGLVRLATGHAAGFPVDDILALSGLGDAPAVNQIGSLTDLGVSLFTVPTADLPVAAQSIPLSPATGIPMLVSSRGNVLRVDRMNRAGFVAGGFEVTGPHVAGIHWTAGPGELFSNAKDSLTLEQHRIASAPNAPGFTVPTGVSLTTGHLLPELMAGLDAVPFVDPAYPALRCLVAIRFSSTPDVVHLYRFLDAPVAAAEELITLAMPVGEGFAGLISVGTDFLLLSGPGGRVKSWQRYAQPAPGQLPAVIGSGTLPALRARAANPNLFIYSQDPFLTNDAVLTGSRNHLDWTTLAEGLATGETDAGPASGLGSPQTITVNAPGGVPVGNQFLPSASVAGFGPVSGLQRPAVIFQPVPGAYAALDPGTTFAVTLQSATPGTQIHYRLPGGDIWTLYDPLAPPELGASGVLTAYTTDPGTGSHSPLATGAYAFAPLPPTLPATAIDADGNGLSDAWERAFGITDPNSDTDGDGFNALTEQNYGSDPLDAASHPPGGSSPVPSIAIAAIQAGVITLTWPGGLVGYILESSPDLHNWNPVEPQPLANTWSEPATGLRKFYRLRKP